MKQYNKLTLDEQLKHHGIETLYGEVIKLKYKDKIITRPLAQKCRDVVKKEFGIDIGEINK